MFNRLVAFIILVVLSPIIGIISMLILINDGLPIFYIQKRIGKNNINFDLYKFRTMKNNTPVIATHLIKNPEKYFIKFGRFLRESSLDEIPQLINIMKSEMSFIGPRPALYNQDDLVSLRTKKGIHNLMPGITGWAQINGRDELSIIDKVEFDIYYKNNKSLSLNLKIIFITIFKVLFKKGVSH